MKTKGDQQLVKRINRSVLLRLLRAQPGLSRARLAQASGLTKSTVSALVRELLDEHWISEADAPVASDGMGRPSTPLQIDAHRRVLVGVEIGVRQMRRVTVSLTGEVLRAHEQALDSSDADAVCRQLAQTVREAWLALQRDQLLLSGVGVCLPGAIDETSDLVRFAPNLGWRDLPFQAMLREALTQAGVPDVELHLHNDGDAAALGEYEFATTGDTDPLIFISCDVGVGAGIVLNDHLFTGARGMAGEIGHSIMQVDGELCSCGRRGCAETFIGARALGTRPGITRAARYLGVLIQNLDVMFNPRLVVVGGQSCSDRPELLAEAIRVVAQYSESSGLPPPQVRGARYGLLAAAVGAAAVAWHHYLRPLRSGSSQPLGLGLPGESAPSDTADAPTPDAHRTTVEST
jgi:predicted NBD/HSP70 family sugar kinase/DNA-binding XRE family transcriptional regulator